MGEIGGQGLGGRGAGPEVGKEEKEVEQVEGLRRHQIKPWERVASLVCRRSRARRFHVSLPLPLQSHRRSKKWHEDTVACVFIVKIWSAPYTWTVRHCNFPITVQNGDEKGSLDVIPSEISSSAKGRSDDPQRTALPSPSPTSFSSRSLVSISFLVCSAVFTAFLPCEMKWLF
ncbi:hypothetical protein B296_00047151 [Ensete ventricosum]|uniref:Uncharacterized protein n=1 Tax=Ensete ventricosum TaxID=4639 RepID=A0A426Z0W3_ENSVE|nr:hypothetical protein B296_00047151 [Ensete ventricosum]